MYAPGQAGHPDNAHSGPQLHAPDRRKECNMAAQRTLPDGFTLETVETSASGVKYAVEVPKAESLDAIRAAYEAEGKNPDEVLLAIWNAQNEQGAKQGQKQAVRVAVKEHGKDSDEVADAIESHQNAARQYIQGAPRGGGGARHESGLTKKEREALGTGVAMFVAENGRPPNEEELHAIAEEEGIDPDLL